MTVIDWTERFTGTAALPIDVRARLNKAGRIIQMKKGDQVFGPTKIPDGLIFLYDGLIRISQTSKSGREIVLYRVEAGESCVLTTACILAEEAYSAEGTAETDVTVVILPTLSFEHLVSEERSFRNFVFAAYSRRLIDVLRVVDDVAFGRIDVRLAERLLKLGQGLKQVRVTHQELASELGTAREVISRVLSDFHKRELIEQSRGLITFRDRDKLTLLARSP